MKGHDLAHGHTWVVGVVGLAVGLVLLFVFPSLNALSGAILLVALLHLVGGLVLLASLYAFAPRRFARVVDRLRSRGAETRANEFDFGWSVGWMNGLWIAGAAVAAFALSLQVAFPSWWPLSVVLILLSVNFFIGNLLLRSSKHRDYVVLPMVDLLSSNEDQVLDAGCGAGRTSIALGRVLGSGNIVALDRFDASYIDDGGRSLLERNLALAGLAERVRIQPGDITEMPFEDGTFHSAVSAHVIDHLGKYKEQGLAEIRRVLKPGGKFLMVVSVPGWALFAVANVLSFRLTPKRVWREIAQRVGFSIRDEGTFNSAWYVLLESRGRQ
jgi:SAM-dependent methyltransferase